MEALHEIQKDLLVKIKNFYSNFKKKGQANMSKQVALTRLANLEKDYHDFTSNHNKIISLNK